jgi:hypothetical protein
MEAETEVNVDEFLARFFFQPPQPVNSFRIELPPAEAPQFFSRLLCQGAQVLYGQPELAQLTERQILTLREYVQSLGWDADYAKKSVSKLVLDYLAETGQPVLRYLPINEIQITFNHLPPTVPAMYTGFKST